jgi:hypothetical protein
MLVSTIFPVFILEGAALANLIAKPAPALTERAVQYSQGLR